MMLVKLRVAASQQGVLPLLHLKLESDLGIGGQFACHAQFSKALEDRLLLLLRVVQRKKRNNARDQDDQNPQRASEIRRRTPISGARQLFLTLPTPTPNPL